MTGMTFLSFTFFNTSLQMNAYMAALSVALFQLLCFSKQLWYPLQEWYICMKEGSKEHFTSLMISHCILQTFLLYRQQLYFKKLSYFTVTTVFNSYPFKRLLYVLEITLINGSKLLNVQLRAANWLFIWSFVSMNELAVSVEFYGLSRVNGGHITTQSKKCVWCCVRLRERLEILAMKHCLEHDTNLPTSEII